MKIKFDYSFDKNGFFDNPQRRESLEYAGNIWSNLINDDFESIPAGAEFTISNPATGNSETIVLEQEIDDLLIYVGSGTLKNKSNSSSNLKTSSYHLKACACCDCNHYSKNENSGKVVNLSHPGILDTENSINTDSLLAQAQVNGTDLQGDRFQRRVSANFRDGGEVTDFEPWVGTISVNPSQDIDWNFDLENTDDSSVDFISVMLHEIGHILGIGVAPIFDALGRGGTFKGINALSVNNGLGVPLEADLSHVAEGFSGNSVLLDPFLNENRSLPSNFDLAMLADIGYEITGFSKQGSLPGIATEESEDIIGSNVDDVIKGLAGNDKIQGNDGNDTIDGGAGNDSLFGTAGADYLLGGSGIDSLHGGVGADTIDGGTDNDILIGAQDNDLLFGRDGDDQLQGNQGADTLVGGAGNDSLFGQDGNDLLLGNEDNDQIQGGEGNDSIQGNAGNDIIIGEAGNDIINGGTGDDTLLGGAGSDRFFFNRDSGNDTINDFIVAEDKIAISALLGFNSGDDLLDAITNSGMTVNPDGLFSEVTLSEGNTIKVFHDLALTVDSFAIVNESRITADAFNVLDLIPTNTGFDLKFDSPLNIDTLDISDLTLVQESTEKAIAGSLVLDRDNSTLSFIKSGGLIEGDRYNLTLKSKEDGFISLTEELLDGNNDGIAGDDFTTELAVAPNNKRVLSLEDINIAPGKNQSLTLSLDNGANLTKAEFTVTYNADILNIKDVAIDSDLADNWSITTENLDEPGIAIITVEGETALNAEKIDLVQLQANVPNEASYGVSDLITIEDIKLNEGNITGIGDTALQTVALTGDVNGDGKYSDADSYLISQMAVGLSDSFEAFPLHDPLILADLNQDGIISALDSFLVRENING